MRGLQSNGGDRRRSDRYTNTVACKGDYARCYMGGDRRDGSTGRQQRAGEYLMRM